MAIYTPRGLKIRLKTDYAFALMARLAPNIDAFKVLKTTEGIELIPAMLALVMGFVAFSLRLDLLLIGINVFLASIFGTILLLTGRFIPGLPKLGEWYSYVSGFGILLIAVSVYGFFTVGWTGVLAFFVGKIAGGIVKLPLEGWNVKRIHSKVGIPLTTSEVNFFSAYLYHAKKLGKSLDITIPDEERATRKWQECLEDLTKKWPEVVRRFTNDE